MGLQLPHKTSYRVCFRFLCQGLTTLPFAVDCAVAGAEITGNHADCRDGRPSPSLLQGLEDLQGNLARLSKSLDAILFRETWKGAAVALNRLLYNKLITECHFSLQVLDCQTFYYVLLLVSVSTQFFEATCLKDCAHSRQETMHAIPFELA